MSRKRDSFQPCVFIACICMLCCHINITRNPEVIWEEQRMDSPAACASCTMLTADESNHSAAGICDIRNEVPHSPYTLHCAVGFPQICPFCWDPKPTGNKSSLVSPDPPP